MTNPPRDPQLFALTVAAARDAIEVVRAIQGGDGFVLDYAEFPDLSWFESGFPHLSTQRYQKINHYRDAYRYSPGVAESKRVRLNELPSFHALEQYCLDNEPIRARFTHSTTPERGRKNLVRISADLLAEHVMERFLHMHGEADPTDALLLPIYLPLEAPAIDDTLAFDVLVPVVVTHFPDVDNELISDSLSLRRLDDQEHLARWPLETRTTESVNELVLSAATHAFVWTGHEVSGDEWAQRYSNAIEGLPWYEIDIAFDALRVVTGFRTGYAQVLLDPKGWAEEYVADLPPLIRGPQMRRYPDALEKWGWIKQAPSVDRDKLPEVRETLRVLSEDSHLQMAARRFSASLLGSDEDDAVVDLCTCLEILLTDDTKTEILHKLRLRGAAVVAQFWPGVDARLIFDAISVVYGLRSFLLHGSKSKKKKPKDHPQKVKWGSRELPTVDVARWISQTVLLWTIRRGHLVPAAEIDRELILDALTQPRTASDEGQRSSKTLGAD
jgi:hypothetical protein